MLSEQMKDQNPENEFSHGIFAFGISEVYNRVSIYINNFKNEGIDSIYASIAFPELVQVICLD